MSALPRAAARQQPALRVVAGLLLLAMVACTIRPEAIAAVFAEPTPTHLRPTRTPKPQPTQPAVLATQPPVLDVVAPPTPAAPLPGIQQNLVDVYALANTAVVSILVSAGTDKASEGSGFLYDSSGHIITNEHVVRTAQSIEVSFSSGEKVAGRLVGSDANSDLAVIVVERIPAGVVALRLGDSDRVQVGQQVVAIGNPFGLRGTMSLGIVSGMGRMLTGSPTDPSVAPIGNYTMPDIIQTDAAINPGNSGGPLINLRSELIGLNVAVYREGQGIGFAIPSNLARDLSDALIKDGKVVRARIGLVINEFRGATEPSAKNLKGPTVGILVGRTIEGGPAAKADIKTDDIVTHVESTPVANAQQLRNALRNKVGQSVSLSVIRNGKTMKIKVVPELWPDEPPDMVATSSKSNGVQSDDLGVTVKPLTRELARVHGVKLTEGLIVTEVEAGSPAAKRSIKAGTIITEVNGKSVSDLTDFNEALKGADLKKGVRLGTISGGSNKVEVLKSVE